MYKNKAFISYRHVPHDAEVARLVQKNLEQFRIPRGIRAAGRKRHVGRIFRDKTDLGTRMDLTEELQRELDDSEFLIVICSPEAAQSRWVPEEIGYFLLHHGSDKILTVLSSGDPETVYDSLFRTAAGAPREPVACDFRGDPRQAVREELPRLASTLIGCTYDELVNRTRRSEKKHTAMIVSVAAAVVLVLSGIAAFFAVSGLRVKKELRLQQEQEARLLAEMSGEALSQGERFDAIRYALESTEEEEGRKPAADEAMLALQEATGAYRTGKSGLLTQTGEFLSEGAISEWKTASTEVGNFLAVCSGKGKNTDLKVWNTDSGARLYDSSEEGERPDGEETDDRGSEDVPNSVLFTDRTLMRAQGCELESIDLATGEIEEIKWQTPDSEYRFLKLLDYAAGNMAVCACTEDSTDLLVFENGSDKAGNEISLEVVSDVIGKKLGRQAVGQGMEAGDEEDQEEDEEDNKEDEEENKEESREEDEDAAEDGNVKVLLELLDGENETKLSPDGRCLFLKGEVFAGEKKENLLCMVDLRTRQAAIPVRGQEILEYQVCEDHEILAVVYEGPMQERFGAKEDSWSSAFSREGKLVLRAVDYSNGEVQWEKESDCARNMDPQLIVNEEIPGKENPAAVLNVGTRTEIYDQKTGDRLYAAEFPGWIGYTFSGQTPEGETALIALLGDGTVSEYCYEDAGMYRHTGELPADMVRAERVGGTLLAEYRNDSSGPGSRILAFGRDAADSDMKVLEADGAEGEFLQGAVACAPSETSFMIYGTDGRTFLYDAMSGQKFREKPADDKEAERYLADVRDGAWDEERENHAEIFDENTIRITDADGEQIETREGNGNTIRGIGWLGKKLYWTEEARGFLWLCDGEHSILLDSAENNSCTDPLLRDNQAVAFSIAGTEEDKILAVVRNTLYCVDPVTQSISARVPDVLAYNPRTETLLLKGADEEGQVQMYISSLYSCSELREKAHRILHEDE